ncbi:MAG TPA: NAD(P)/FAD-dependent oxidoreductase [Phycisphaerae bacterium]|nr:NAD(P)/FAD-dependent oxidoreductase [Phycisphaerae bacterium]
MPEDPTGLFDVIVVGGGPAGLFATYYAGLRGMRCLLIDSLEQLGGQLAALYPEKFIYDVAGFPAVLARALVQELVKQASQYKPTIVLSEQVRRLDSTSENILELSTDKAAYRSRSVIVCAGAGSFTPKRLPNVNCQEYEGRGVCYFVRDIQECRGKRVLVVGGGDSAVDWSLNLLRVTDRITLIHRLDHFRAHEDNVKKLFASPVTIKTFHELKAVHGNERVERATIIESRTKAEETLEVESVLINIGFSSTLGPIHDWGLTLDKHGIVANSRMETNLPGVYAAGDVASYPGKLKLIATGFGEAAMAVNHAKAFIDPASKSFPGHSSALVPKQREGAGAGGKLDVDE